MSENGKREITYLEAVREALTQELRRDPEVFLLGEDIGVYGDRWRGDRRGAYGYAPGDGAYVHGLHHHLNEPTGQPGG